MSLAATGHCLCSMCVYVCVVVSVACTDKKDRSDNLGNKECVARIFCHTGVAIS